MTHKPTKLQMKQRNVLLQHSYELGISVLDVSGIPQPPGVQRKILNDAEEGKAHVIDLVKLTNRAKEWIIVGPFNRVERTTKVKEI